MEDMKRRQMIPTFGNWDYCDEMPITQYFESAMQAGLIRGHYFATEDDSHLYKPYAAPPPPLKPAHHYHHNHHNHRKVKKADGEKQQKQQVSVKEQLRKQGKVYDLTNQISPKKQQQPKAVDEDLYKIPPELLSQKPKRKRVLRNLWSGCLGLGCVA